MHNRLEGQPGDAHCRASVLRGLWLGLRVQLCRESAEIRPSIRRKCVKCRAGLTLTEVVVASGLLVIAMVPVLKGLTVAHLHTSIIERKTKSLALAQARLDSIRARSVYHYSDSFAESDQELGDSYLCDVTDVPISSNLRLIAVSVGQDIDGDGNLSEDEVEVSLATEIAKRWGS